MEKIIITGNSGSGKTWLAHKISALKNIPNISLDDVFWEPGGFGRQRNEQETENDLKKICKQNRWIVEGVFGHLIDTLLPFADTLIYMDLSWDECKSNLMERGSESSKQLNPLQAVKKFNELIQWASEYNTRQSKSSKWYHENLYNDFQLSKYRLNSREKINSYLKKQLFTNGTHC